MAEFRENRGAITSMNSRKVGMRKPNKDSKRKHDASYSGVVRW
jgi:hypothetical protein